MSPNHWIPTPKEKMTAAERIGKELLHEKAAIWYISDRFGAKIMIKLAESSIKAVVKGCKMELLFGRDESLSPNIFHVGVKIYDDPANCQIISCSQRFLDGHLSLSKIMHLEKVQVQLYNELNMCQAYGYLSLSNTDKHNVHALLGNPKLLRKGEFDDNWSRSLDNFQYNFDDGSKEPLSGQKIRTLIVNEQIKNWDLVKNIFFTDTETIHLSITDPDEGGVLEKEILITLSSLFGRDIFRGPKIPFKKSTRELTDILAFSEYGIFMVEAKALGVFNASNQRSIDRKVAGLQKQIEKAIKQLVGAAKRISENTAIFDRHGNEILFNRALLPHGIVLISEQFNYGDWDNTIFKLLEAMSQSRIWIHVMDMREFMQFVGYANGNKNLFDYFLGERIKNFVKDPSFNIQTQFVGETLQPWS